MGQFLTDNETKVLTILAQKKDIPSTLSVRSIAIQTNLSMDDIKNALERLQGMRLVESREEYFYLTGKGVKIAYSLERGY